MVFLLFVCHSSQNQQDVLPTGPVQTGRLGFARQPGTTSLPSPPLYICVCGLSPSVSPVQWIKSGLLCKKLSEQWSPSDTTAGDQAWESASSSSFWSLRLCPPAYQMISLFRVDRSQSPLKRAFIVSDCHVKTIAVLKVLNLEGFYL